VVYVPWSDAKLAVTRCHRLLHWLPARATALVALK
jgi:hypothetical protein